MRRFMYGRRMAAAPMQVDAVQMSQDANRALTRAGRAITRSPWAGGALGLWLIGLLIVFVLPAPISITEDMLSAYNQKSKKVDMVNDRLTGVMTDMYEHEMRYHDARGWFPWFASAEQKQRTKVLKKRYDLKKAEVDKVAQEQLYAEREANKELGLFSAYGIGQAKEKFWSSFERAKVIGRNNTFIDGIFAIITNRDSELIDIVAKLAVYLVVNMGTAMFVMFWIFVAGLPRFIWTFGAGWLSGSAFFLLAIIGAASVMLSFTGLVAGAAGGATYGLIRLTGQRRRIATAQDGRRRLQGQHVPGYAHVNLAGESYYRPQRAGADAARRRPGGGSSVDGS